MKKKFDVIFFFQFITFILTIYAIVNDLGTLHKGNLINNICRTSIFGIAFIASLLYLINEVNKERK